MFAPSPIKDLLANGNPDAVGHLERVMERRVRQEQREILVTHTRRNVVIPKAPSEDPSHMSEGRRGRRRGQVIELVNIHTQERTRPGGVVSHGLHQRPPVRLPGQFIRHRAVPGRIQIHRATHDRRRIVRQLLHLHAHPWVEGLYPVEHDQRPNALAAVAQRKNRSTHLSLATVVAPRAEDLSTLPGRGYATHTGAAHDGVRSDTYPNQPTVGSRRHRGHRCLVRQGIPGHDGDRVCRDPTRRLAQGAADTLDSVWGKPFRRGPRLLRLHLSTRPGYRELCQHAAQVGGSRSHHIGLHRCGKQGCSAHTAIPESNDHVVLLDDVLATLRKRQ